MLGFCQLGAGGHRLVARLLGLLQFADAGTDRGEPVTDLLTAGRPPLRLTLHS